MQANFSDKPKKKRPKPRSVMESLGYDPDRVWYPIDNRLKGYEVSNDCYVRSLKLLKDECGCLLRPNDDGYYNLTDSEGHAMRLNIDDIKDLAKHNPFCVAKKTTDVTSAGRNTRTFQQKKDTSGDFLKQPKQVHFTIVKDENKTNSPKREVINPIYQIPPREVY